jgi:hypothetical protein
VLKSSRLPTPMPSEPTLNNESSIPSDYLDKFFSESESPLDFCYSLFPTATELKDYFESNGMNISRHTLRDYDNKTRNPTIIAKRIIANELLLKDSLHYSVFSGMTNFLDISRYIRDSEFGPSTFKRSKGSIRFYRTKGFNERISNLFNINSDIIFGLFSFFQLELAYEIAQNEYLSELFWKRADEYIHNYKLAIFHPHSNFEELEEVAKARNHIAFFYLISGGADAFKSWKPISLDLYSAVRDYYSIKLTYFQKTMLKKVAFNTLTKLDFANLGNELYQEIGFGTKHMRSLSYATNWMLLGRLNEVI